MLFPNGNTGLPHDVNGITAGTSTVSQTPTQHAQQHQNNCIIARTKPS